MDEETREEILNSGRLILSRKRLFRHYAGVFIFLFLNVLTISFIVTAGTDPNFVFKSFMLVFLIPPLCAIGSFINQYSALKLKTFETGLSMADNYSVAKDAVKSLKWKIQVNNKGFIEAMNNYTSIGRTSGEDMISIIITDNKILVNSIGNVDKGGDWQVGLSFGKHTSNVKKFLDAFETLSQFQTKK